MVAELVKIRDRIVENNKDCPTSQLQVQVSFHCLFAWYLTINVLKLLEPTTFSSTYLTSLKLMFSLLTFPTFLSFILISVSLFLVFGNLPLCSRLFLQIHYYYFSETLDHNAFPITEGSQCNHDLLSFTHKDEGNDPTIISMTWVWVGFIVVKDEFLLMNP